MSTYETQKSMVKRIEFDDATEELIFYLDGCVTGGDADYEIVSTFRDAFDTVFPPVQISRSGDEIHSAIQREYDVSESLGAGERSVDQNEIVEKAKVKGFIDHIAIGLIEGKDEIKEALTMVAKFDIEDSGISFLDHDDKLAAMKHFGVEPDVTTGPDRESTIPGATR